MSEFTTILYLSHVANDEGEAVADRRILMEVAEQLGFEAVGADTMTEPRQAIVERIMEGFE